MHAFKVVASKTRSYWELDQTERTKRTKLNPRDTHQVMDQENEKWRPSLMTYKMQISS